MTRGVLHRELRFLTLDEVLSLHEAAIDEHGGSHGVRDMGLLESAAAMPRQAFGGEYAHDVPFGMAAAYLFHICKNHPFVDGNKRTAFMSCVAFLRLNGWSLTASEDAAYDTVIAVAESRLPKDGISAWIEGNVRPRPSLELREFLRALDYSTLASVFGAIAAGPTPERVATIREAAEAIPAIDQANIGALAVEQSGDDQSAVILRQHSMLLTALYRIAEDMGYEW